MIDACPRCGAGVPMDTPTPARYELGECPRCRFVATTRSAIESGDESETTRTTRTETPAIADGGREVSDGW